MLIDYFILIQGPPTPCPARVEYATPVFARNYQGVWRYVVQIPYEGYFTQTVEVTRYVPHITQEKIYKFVIKSQKTSLILSFLVHKYK